MATPTLTNDRIIQSMSSQANDYLHKAQSTTNELVKQGFLAAREEQINLITVRLNQYGVSDVQAFLDALVEKAG